MTGPKGDSEFCFPRLRIEVEENKTQCFPWSQLLSVLLRYTSQLKNRKKLRRNRLLDAGWLTNLPRFQGACPDYVRVEVHIVVSLGS